MEGERVHAAALHKVPKSARGRKKKKKKKKKAVNE